MRYLLQRKIGYILGHELQHRDEHQSYFAQSMIDMFKINSIDWLKYGWYLLTFQYDKKDALIDHIFSNVQDRESHDAETRADKTEIKLYRLFQEVISFDERTLRSFIFDN